VDVLVEVGGWEHECCGPAFERNQLVDLACLRWTGADGRLRLIETHHHLDGDEQVVGRVVDIELARDGVPIRPVLRVPSGGELGSLSTDDRYLADPWTDEPIAWNGEELLLTIRPGVNRVRSWRVQ
jgi:hypothetical protein